MNYSLNGYAISYGTWVKGKKEGFWASYDADFNLTIIEFYRKGKLKNAKENPSCFPSLENETLDKLNE